METLGDKISEYWQISRTALATSEDCSRHSRMIYVKNCLKKYDASLIENMSNKQVWFAIEEQINWY